MSLWFSELRWVQFKLTTRNSEILSLKKGLCVFCCCYQPRLFMHSHKCHKFWLFSLIFVVVGKCQPFGSLIAIFFILFIIENHVLWQNVIIILLQTPLNVYTFTSDSDKWENWKSSDRIMWAVALLFWNLWLKFGVWMTVNGCCGSSAAVMSLRFTDEDFQSAWKELDEPQLDGGWELFTETMGVKIYRLYDKVGDRNAHEWVSVGCGVLYGAYSTFINTGLHLFPTWTLRYFIWHSLTTHTWALLGY